MGREQEETDREERQEFRLFVKYCCEQLKVTLFSLQLAVD